MACLLFGTKQLPEPIMTYCQLDLREESFVKFKSNYNNFHTTKQNTSENVVC